MFKLFMEGPDDEPQEQRTPNGGRLTRGQFTPGDEDGEPRGDRGYRGRRGQDRDGDVAEYVDKPEDGGRRARVLRELLVRLEQWSVVKTEKPQQWQ